MSMHRRDALIEAPVARVWELVGNPSRHPSWWPRIVEVRGERFEVDDRYVQVTTTPTGSHETTLAVDARHELREIGMHCLNTGMFARWRLAEARGQTFVELDLGMEPGSPQMRMFDATVGRLYFRRWAEQSIDALKRAATD